VSTEEIIRAWKHNEDEAEKQPEGEQPSEGEKPLKGKKKQEGKAPSNPAGEPEISDEDLEAVEGGISMPFTCDANSC
jgi:mersacidin/lichenicidin family type 2 lantibiotic